jgi:hypothetical protein
MSVGMDYREEIVNLSKELPDHELREVIDFALFLKARKQGFSYMEVKESTEYVRNLRVREGKRVKSGRKFIEELIEWQKSNS